MKTGIFMKVLAELDLLEARLNTSRDYEVKDFDINIDNQSGTVFVRVTLKPGRGK